MNKIKYNPFMLAIACLLLMVTGWLSDHFIAKSGTISLPKCHYCRWVQANTRRSLRAME